MAEDAGKKKPLIEQIGEEKAAKILGAADFLREKNMDRIFHVVRDPKDPSVILSMTLMERM